MYSFRKLHLVILKCHDVTGWTQLKLNLIKPGVWQHYNLHVTRNIYAIVTRYFQNYVQATTKLLA
jgi:hypothetical protein